MKKAFSVFLILMLLVSSCGIVSANAAQTQTLPDMPTWIRRFSFTNNNLDVGKVIKKEVYAGPGNAYMKLANGGAVVQAQVFRYAGKEGNWLMIRYQNSRKQMRYGYIDMSEYSDLLADVPTLVFDSYDAVVVRQRVALWDSLMDSTMGAVVMLEGGTHVTYLGTYVEGSMAMAYVELQLYGQMLRGFMSLSDIQVNQTIVEENL